MSSQGRSTSSTMPSSSSVPTTLPPAPPLTSSQQRPQNVYARLSSAGSTSMGAGFFSDPNPVLISNQDIVSMFAQVKEQLQRVERSNEILKKDMENLRTRNDVPASRVTTPIRSRILDFGTPQSAGHQGDFVSMQGSTRIPDPIYTTGVSTSRGQQSHPESSYRTPDGGNMFNNYTSNNTVGTNNFQDPGVSPVMARELQKLKDMISSVPGVVQPIPEVAPTAHRISRFAPPICDAEIPKRFQTPNMKLYDGTTDPEEHIAQYRERMEIIPIPSDLKEACLCKGFGSTLTGSALKWLLNVPPTLLLHLLI